MFVLTSLFIGRSVSVRCYEATREYEGDCVEALISLLEDENKEFKVRNSAIWALGQLGDSRALPVFMSYRIGDIPEKESLDGVISQYELRKAINMTNGGVNLIS